MNEEKPFVVRWRQTPAHAYTYAAERGSTDCQHCAERMTRKDAHARAHVLRGDLNAKPVRIVPRKNP